MRLSSVVQSLNIANWKFTLFSSLVIYSSKHFFKFISGQSVSTDRRYWGMQGHDHLRRSRSWNSSLYNWSLSRGSQVDEVVAGGVTAETWACSTETWAGVTTVDVDFITGPQYSLALIVVKQIDRAVIMKEFDDDMVDGLLRACVVGKFVNGLLILFPLWFWLWFYF